MAQFELVKDEIKDSGANLAFIAAQKREGVWNPGNALKKQPTSFPFLLDENRAVTKAYGLYHALGVDAINIAHPATLVIDSHGVVRSIYRGSTQLDRVPVEVTLNEVRKLRDQQ
ncbi:MAG: redoxin family protein [Acidobacteriales bacterium]|nr:redoxin family protein [Terriglobales bacterium]